MFVKSRQEGKLADTFGVNSASYLKKEKTLRGFSLKHSGGRPILNVRIGFQEENRFTKPTGTNGSTGQMHQV